MKILLVEDDFVTRKIFKNLLNNYGEVDIAVNGVEALEAVSMSYDNGDPYDVIFLDVLMPEMDGQEVLKNTRKLEEERNIFGKDGIKIIMTTVLKDSENIIKAFREQCEGYIIKPAEKENVEKVLRKLELI